jgi:ankyrin repeat protein
MKKLAIFFVVIGIAAGAIAMRDFGSLEKVLETSNPKQQPELIPAANSLAPPPASSVAQISAPLAAEHAIEPQKSSTVATTNLQDALMSAIRNGNVEDVKFVLAKGADVNAKDKYEAQYDGDEDGGDRTPLHYAIEYIKYGSTIMIAELLISKGADVNAVDATGSTPLHDILKTSAERAEVRKALEDIAASLIANGANVNAQHSMTGETPLHMAAYNGFEDTVALLLVKGADANARNHSGQTPLFGPLTTDVAEILIKHGADLTIKSKAGDTPLSFALTHNYSNLANSLRANGAK